MTAREWIVLAIGLACVAAGLAGLLWARIVTAVRARLRTAVTATVRPDLQQEIQQALDTVSPCCCHHDRERQQRKAERARRSRRAHARADARRLANAIAADPDRWREFEKQVLREGPS